MVVVVFDPLLDRMLKFPRIIVVFQFDQIFSDSSCRKSRYHPAYECVDLECLSG